MTRRILLCDDEYHILRASEIKFSRAGYDVTCASDGQEAWETITSAEEPFDMVITDYQMPRLDGLGLVARLRENEATAELPVIMLTAKRFELDEEHLQQDLRIECTVAKPFSPRELLMRVTQILEGAAFPAEVS